MESTMAFARSLAQGEANGRMQSHVVDVVERSGGATVREVSTGDTGQVSRA